MRLISIWSDVNFVLFEVQLVHQNPLQHQLHIIHFLLVNWFCLFDFALVFWIPLKKHKHVLCLYVRREQNYTPPAIVNQTFQFFKRYVQVIIAGCNKKIHPFQDLLSSFKFPYRFSDYPLVSWILQPMKIHINYLFVVLRLC